MLTDRFCSKIFFIGIIWFIIEIKFNTYKNTLHYYSLIFNDQMQLIPTIQHDSYLPTFLIFVLFNVDIPGNNKLLN